MKVIIIISLILIVGLSLASGYTPEQQTTLDGMRLSFQLGVAYQQTQLGQNIANYNALVDQYNTWVRQHFGEDPNLLVSRIDSVVAASLVPKKTGTEPKRPFNTSSDLSKFGKQEVHNSEGRMNTSTLEADLKSQELADFLNA